MDPPVVGVPIITGVDVVVASYHGHALSQQNATTSILHGLRKGPLLPEGVYYRDVANAFNFSPLLSTQFLIDGQAYLMAFAGLFTVFVLPLGRVIMLAWFWFAPADSGTRGKALTLLDFTNKYLLASLIVMSVMGVALDVRRIIVIPWFNLPKGLLTAGTALEIRITSGLSSDAVGSWLYFVACVFNFIIGQVAVLVHQCCEQWEAQLLHDDAEQDTPSVFERMGSAPRHPIAAIEAPIDHVFRPDAFNGIRFTRSGKVTVWVLAFLLAACTLVALVVPIFRIDQVGIVGDLVQNKQMRSREFSIASWTADILNTGWKCTPWQLSGLLLVFCGVCPMLRSAGLMVLVTWPLSLPRQKRLFDFVEVCSAWAAMDVLLVLLLVLLHELALVSRHITKMATPNASELLLDIF